MRHGTGEQPHRHTGRVLAVILVTVLLIAAVIAGIHMQRSNVGGSVAALAQTVIGRVRDTQTSSAMGSGTDADQIMPQDVADTQYPKAISAVDFNSNGVDDYTDIMLGARADAEAAPTYDDGYYQGGYPPDDRGACTDLVWRALRNAGYDLKAMVDADIATDPTSYAAVVSTPDPNIDFRRTGVLDVFFRKYGQNLTLDIADHEQWQQGDIVVFRNVKHIGVISDKRDRDGVAFVLHNMNQKHRENDYLAFANHMEVTGHYRWDASKVPQHVLRAWQ